MALTAEGSALTAANQRRQLALASSAVSASKPIWQRVLSSQSIWLAAQLEILRRFHADSQEVTEAYIEAYRRAEGVKPTPVELVAFPLEEMTSVALVGGPYSVKNFIGQGSAPDSAMGSGFNKFSGLLRRQVLAGGRMMIDATSQGDSNAVGWRRVTDGNPCTFCAMLASRGPVYQSSEKASAVAGTGLKYHSHCGCSAEIVYGDWIPTELEQQFIDSYDSAAREASRVDGVRTQDTVLWRMRRDGKFRDSSSIRNISSDPE